MAVVITGVSEGGIGAACATFFARQGCHVFGSVRKLEDAAQLGQDLGDSFTPLVFDVTEAAAVQAAADKVGNHLKGRTLQALINNAGISIAPHPLELMPLDLVRRQLEVNVVAQLQVIQAMTPLLKADSGREGPPGRIINISSVYGSYGMPFMGAYCASKAALELMSDALRLEMRVHGIRVVVIRPGPIKTHIWTKARICQNQDSTGDWQAYSGSDYSQAMQGSKSYLDKYTDTPGVLMNPARVAETVWQAAMYPNPKPHYVITNNWMENWLLPNLLPKHIIDREMCKRFGIRRLQLGATSNQKSHCE